MAYPSMRAVVKIIRILKAAEGKLRGSTGIGDADNTGKRHC